MRRQHIRGYGSPPQQRRQSSSGEAVGVDLRVALADASAPAPSPPRHAPELDVARHKAELSRSLVADVGRIAERLRPEHPPRVPPPPPAPVPPSAGVALRVRLEMDGWTEPDYSREDAQHEAPDQLGATLVASALTPGSSYALLRFEDPATVPRENFLQGPYMSRISFVAPATGTYRKRVSFMSNSTTLFRCVATESQ